MIQPNVELWMPGDEELEHLARCARICYRTQGGKRTPMELAQQLADSGHLSMFRHITFYYLVPFHAIGRHSHFYEKLRHSEFVGFWANKPEKRIYLAVNGQFWLEHSVDFHPLEKYLGTVHDFERNWKSRWMIRYTFVADTQISTTRELNRTSPNNISEQSTRYVDFVKKSLDFICKPHWYDGLPRWKRWMVNAMLWVETSCYKLARKVIGLKAQDAREFLPLCSQSRVAYTYSAKEWRAILNLRYHGSTGAPHPNAKLIATFVYERLTALGYELDPLPKTEYDLKALIAKITNHKGEKKNV